MLVMAFRSGASMKGPFLTERAMLFRLPLHDELVRPLVVAGLVTQRRLSPGRHRVITLHAALASAMRMIDGIHHHTADRRTYAHVTHTSRLAQRDVFMVEVANLSDRCHADHIHQANFARRQLYVSVCAFLRDQLCTRASAPCHLRT